MRVSLDRTTAFAPGAAGFPWRAMLSLWLAPGAAPVRIPAPPRRSRSGSRCSSTCARVRPN